VHTKDVKQKGLTGKIEELNKLTAEEGRKRDVNGLK